jgi:hypothetical protein
MAGAAEIVAQVALARSIREVRKVVFMGMGEPFHNLESVLEAIEWLGTEGGIGHKSLVFSTVGDRRAFERLPLFILSTAMFGETPTLQQALRQWPRLLKPQLLASLTWRRLSLSRSFLMPVMQLEGLEGDRLVGTTYAHYETSEADSVLELAIEGTRAP